MLRQLWCLVLVASCCFLSSDLVEAAEARRPNIIVFLVDDMGWIDCGAYGSQYYLTPHIDRFAQRGMRFSNAYAQPLCSPTRCSLLTGKYSARHGITSSTGHLPPQAEGEQLLPKTASPQQPYLMPSSKNYMDLSEVTLAEALQSAGYRTAHLGKWHLGLEPVHWPERQGFDWAFHCHPDPGPPGNYFSPYAVTATGKASGKNRVGTITDGPPGEYIVDRLADEAVKFIGDNKDRPFFINLWNYGVHGPWGHKEAYTRELADRSDPRGLQGNPIMASMLKSVDECFGRVIAALDQHGLTDNTIIVFNSDNGGNTHSNSPEDAKTQGARGKSEAIQAWRKWAGDRPPTNNSPLRDGKGTLYEGGTRVPLIWVWPNRIQPNTQSTDVVGHIDLYPTLLDLIGQPLPVTQTVDGVSYASVLRATGSLKSRPFFNYFPHGPSPGRAGGVWVRSGDWKLIRWFGDLPFETRFELFNLREDLSETTNLASKQPQLVKELDALIDKFLADTGATYPRPNPAYKPQAASRPTSAAAATDPLENWKARACEAAVAEGIVTVTSQAKAGSAFLGHGTGQLTGPATLSFRVRSAAGGAGKVEWLGDPAAPVEPRSVAFTIEPGDWQVLTVRLETQGILGTTRLYLPAHEKPVEVDWIELNGRSANALRWDFNSSGGSTRKYY